MSFAAVAVTVCVTSVVIAVIVAAGAALGAILSYFVFSESAIVCGKIKTKSILWRLLTAENFPFFMM